MKICKYVNNVKICENIKCVLGQYAAETKIETSKTKRILRNSRKKNNERGLLRN